MVPMTLSVQLLYGPDIDINTVKGVGESIDGVMEILRAVYLKCTPPNIYRFDFPLFVFVE
jgi:hypothetical protein